MHLNSLLKKFSFTLFFNNTGPYDKNINPAENKSVNWFTLGEGYHNYHHVFPYDYSTGEYSWEVFIH